MTRAATLARARLTGLDPASRPTLALSRQAQAAIAGAGLAIAWLTAGPTTAVLLAVAAVAGILRSQRRARAEARHRRRADLPAALDRLATALRSGASIPMALDEAAKATPPPLGEELAGLARATSRGRPLAEVLDGWTTTHDDRGTRLAATALLLASRLGSAPARAVDSVAATLRERTDLAAERRALAAQARTSALVLAVAPLGFTALLVASDGAASTFLLGTPAGWACLVGGVALDGAGAWWMARLVRGDEP